jgi:hypothetical protein
MKNLELSDAEAEALTQELASIINRDRGGDTAKLRPEPARSAPLPPLRNYEPASKGRYQRRRR